MLVESFQPIDVPLFPLKHATADEYCLSLRVCRGMSYWWYQDPANQRHTYSKPFQDGFSSWWYQIKPGFAWPVNILNALTDIDLPFAKRYLGCQYVVEDAAQANSFIFVNVIQNLPLYSSASIPEKRRAIKKGLRLCSLYILDHFDKEVVEGCRESWNNLVRRTGWKTVVSQLEFEESWKALVNLPGTSILVGCEKETGKIAGFLIIKIINQTAYVDTIASMDTLLHLNVNDALLYAFLVNAQRIPTVQNAHYSLVSNVIKLERFKRSLGFVPIKYPARTVLTPGVGIMLKRLFPDKYKRLIGKD
jgi:hypothetical protein